MHLVLIDLIPALLSWGGRDRSEPPEVAPGAAHAMGHLYERFHVVGIADAGTPSPLLRRHLEKEDLARFFDSVSTSATHGPALTARAVRRIVAAAARGERPIVVTGRAHLADELARARIPTVLTTHEAFESAAEGVFALADGRLSP